MNKKVKLSLIGVDGNIFSIIGLFSREARKQGWSAEEIKAVQKEVTDQESYDDALGVILKYTEEPDEEPDLEDSECLDNDYLFQWTTAKSLRGDGSAASPKQ